MPLFQRYKRLGLWHKIGFWGSVASIIALIYAFLPSSSTRPTASTVGDSSPAVAVTGPNANVSINYSGNPEPQSHAKEDSKPSQLILTDIHDDPPSVKHIEDELDRVIRQAERRLFRISDGQQLYPNSTHLPTIEISGEFDGWLENNTKKGSLGKAIDFTLSNQGEIPILVDKLWLTVLENGDCSWYSFPVGLRVPINRIKYEVTITPTTSDYTLTEDMFRYDKGACEHFSVSIKSDEGLWYRIKASARWFKEEVSNQKDIATTREYVIGFPRTIDCTTLLANAKKLDIQINPGAIRDLRKLPRLAGESTRILIPGSSYYNPTFFEQRNLLEAGDNIRPTGEGVEWCTPTCSGGDFQRLEHQFIIIDDSMVLVNYRGLYGLLLREPSEVGPFRNAFKASWDSPMPFDTIDQMRSTLRDHENPERLRALAAYNLRHSIDPNSLAVLADAVFDPSEKVNKAAKASLQVFESSTLMPLRSMVTQVVYEKCKNTSAMNTAGAIWLREFLKRIQGHSQ